MVLRGVYLQLFKFSKAKKEVDLLMSKYMEIEVNGEIYKLVAGFGFLHEVNKKVTVDVPNTGKKKK